MPSGVYERKPFMKNYPRGKKLRGRLRWWYRHGKVKGVHPQTPGSWSYAAVGEMFGMSATHVLRLLKTP